MAHEVIWDEQEQHLAVRTHSVQGPNFDLYDPISAGACIGVALRSHVPVYVLVTGYKERRQSFFSKEKTTFRVQTKKQVWKNPIR